MAENVQIELYRDYAWRVAATVELRGGSSRHDPTWLEYDIDYALGCLGARDLSAVSTRYPVNMELRDLRTFPAFTVDLMPQGEARRVLEARLRERGQATSDWSILRSGARNPVGNLRVAESVEGERADAPGVPRSEVVQRGDAFREWAQAQGVAMTGASDTSGASPKLLLTADEAGLLHADGALSDARARRHFIVKFARGRTRRDAQVLANEAPYLELARGLGLRVGEPLTYEDGALFIPRFDRARAERGVLRRGVESLFSLLGEVQSGASLAFERVCQELSVVVDEPERELVELVLRDAASLALGNTDNHGRNTSLLKYEDGRIELSPLYDFAPMFLDPELIKRSTRWRSEAAAPAAPDWNDVCDSLEALVPRERLAPGLRDFALRIEALPDAMRHEGVDQELIERRQSAIRDVAAALSAVEGG